MKKSLNIRLSVEAIRLVEVMAQHHGLNRTAMLEFLIRAQSAQAPLEQLAEKTRTVQVLEARIAALQRQLDARTDDGER